MRQLIFLLIVNFITAFLLLIFMVHCFRLKRESDRKDSRLGRLLKAGQDNHLANERLQARIEELEKDSLIMVKRLASLGANPFSDEVNLQFDEAQGDFLQH